MPRWGAGFRMEQRPHLRPVRAQRRPILVRIAEGTDITQVRRKTMNETFDTDSNQAIRRGSLRPARTLWWTGVGLAGVALVLRYASNLDDWFDTANRWGDWDVFAFMILLARDGGGLTTWAFGISLLSLIGMAAAGLLAGLVRVSERSGAR